MTILLRGYVKYVKLFTKADLDLFKEDHGFIYTCVFLLLY